MKSDRSLLKSVTQLVQSIIPQSKLDRSYGKEVSFLVPSHDIKHFPSLFSILNQNKKIVESYGISMPTLEEVSLVYLFLYFVAMMNISDLFVVE